MAHGLNNSGQDADEGFLNALIKMLESDRDKPVFDELDLFFKEDPIMRPFPLVPDPNQLSIPSEPTVRGSFTDRLPKKSAFSMAQFYSNRRTGRIGDEIVLGEMLKQLDSLPAFASKNTEGAVSIPGSDISTFFGTEMLASQRGIDIGNLRRIHNKSGLLGRDI